MKLIDYIKGNRHGKEANRLEREALEDAFLQEALEGYDAVKGRHEETIKRIEQRISAKPRERKHRLFVMLSIAASFLVLISIGSYFWIINPAKTDIQTIAKQNNNAQTTRKDFQANAIAYGTTPILHKEKAFSTANSNTIATAEKTVEEKAQSITPTINALPKSTTEPAKTSITNSPLAYTNSDGTVEGVVKDEKGETVIGATVKVKGTNIGTVTDINGAFKLPIKPSADTKLEISYVGMENKEIYASDKNMQIALTENNKDLNNVVVTGYGTTKKRDLIASSSSVNPKDLKNAPVTSAAEALEGKLAGVTVTQTEGSPDATSKIRVRGGGSLTQNSNPLYIVDGFPVSDISNISPTDIQSIDVLKDASATAIYGSQGANGVIIITTKNHKFNKSEFKKYFLSKATRSKAKKFVLAKFILNKDQKPSDIKILESSTEDAKIEAIKIIESSPKWSDKKGKTIQIKLKW